MHIALKILGLNQLIIHVLKNNTKALYYNKQLGFSINLNNSNIKSYELELTNDSFFENKSNT